MHLLTTTSTSLDEITEAVDLRQPPGDVISNILRGKHAAREDKAAHAQEKQDQEENQEPTAFAETDRGFRFCAAAVGLGFHACLPGHTPRPGTPF